MGVINVTPDSYFAGSRYPEADAAAACAQAMVKQGAHILDIGAESTRPPQIYSPDEPARSFQVSETEELERISEVIEQVCNAVIVPISVDTMKAKVARHAVSLGASMINDVNGFRDPEMRAVAAETDVSVCIMHMQGSPATMQKNPQYSNGVTDTILRFFDHQVTALIAAGVKERNICLDPGLCFGKTIENNVEILQNVQLFRSLGFPLLMGVSRKSVLATLCNKPAPGSLAATITMNTLLAKAGVEIIRIHDVEEHRDMVSVLRGIGAIPCRTKSTTRTMW
ncbi:Dihydropteroate synthase [Chlamydiales bacterium SCGC AG-110-P3]|nr:Dihydropteroate synthase [Chlamydiales bacterium SCGC AG-110-P3]